MSADQEQGTPQSSLTQLSTQRHCEERIRQSWPEFLQRRQDRLEQQRRMGQASEKVAEGILEDLFTQVLDWPLGNLNNQMQYADLVLTDLGIKRLLIEVKRPQSLAWQRASVERALEQAKRYSLQQKVRVIAVSDGCTLYAADFVCGELRDRVLVHLYNDRPPLELWWLSRQGIYRDSPYSSTGHLRLLPESPLQLPAETSPQNGCETLLHPKYKLPARCFAYVADYARPVTWKLPYLLADGTIDAKRLPKAVQCILTNYRGARVGGIPEEAIGGVLTRLACAASHAGHMPPHAANPAPAYRQLAEALDQLGISLDAPAQIQSRPLVP